MKYFIKIAESIGEMPKSDDWSSSSIMNNNASILSKPPSKPDNLFQKAPKPDSNKEYTGPGKNLINPIMQFGDSLKNDFDSFTSKGVGKHLHSMYKDQNVTVNPTKNSELTLGMGNFGPDKVKLPGFSLKVDF